MGKAKVKVYSDILKVILKILKKVSSDIVYVVDGGVMVEEESGILFIKIPEFSELEGFAVDRKVFVDLLSLFEDKDCEMEIFESGIVVRGIGFPLKLDIQVFPGMRKEIEYLFDEEEIGEINIDFSILVEMGGLVVKKISDVFGVVYLFSDGVFVATPSACSAYFIEIPVEIGIRSDLLEVFEGVSISSLKVSERFLKVEGDLEGVQVFGFLKIIPVEKGRFVRDAVLQALQETSIGKVVVDFEVSSVEEVKKRLEVEDVVRLYQEGKEMRYSVERVEFKVDDVLGKVVEGEGLVCEIDGADFAFLFEKRGDIFFLKEKVLMKVDDNYIMLVSTL